MGHDPRDFLEKSFLSPLLEKDDVTDISYNGEKVFYVSNVDGRKPFEIDVSNNDIAAFLRQIANLCEKQFSFQSPILDVSFSKYRINAVFSSLARSKNEKSYSFSLRIASGRKILDDDDEFFGKGNKELLLSILNQDESIVIGGVTSSGKTELQKWLISHMHNSKRVIVIDNVEELGLLDEKEIDLTVWLVNEHVPQASFASLVKNSLRNNPDYVIVAEARGEEMLDALVSAMSGHPIITSIHSKDIESMPERMARLAMMSPQKLELDNLIDDINHHIKYYVYLNKEEDDEGIHRHIDTIGFLKDDGIFEYLYRRNEE